MIKMSQQQSSLEGVVHHQHHHQQQQQQQGVRERERAAAESTFIQTWQGVTAAMPSCALIGHSTNMSATSQRERESVRRRERERALCCAVLCSLAVAETSSTMPRLVRVSSQQFRSSSEQEGFSRSYSAALGQSTLEEITYLLLTLSRRACQCVCV